MVWRESLYEEHALYELSAEVDEVVLWFEHDLYDQLMLCYLLSRLLEHSHPSVHLSLLCINEFPGVQLFYGLGQLSAGQVVQLHRKWLPVSEEQLTLGRKVWTAYSARSRCLWLL